MNLLAPKTKEHYPVAVRPIIALLSLLAGCATTQPRPIAAPDIAAPDIAARDDVQLAESAASSHGPTIKLQEAPGTVPTTSISALMYFVKLISPEPAQLSVNDGNTQKCRMLAIDRQLNPQTFTARCQFEITGAGTQQSIIDQSPTIERHQERLSNGGTIKRQLGSIKVTGSGQGEIIAEGSVSGDQAIVNRIRMNFVARGQRIPVTIGINDICHIDGVPHAVNDQLIEVDALEFRRQEAEPTMYVTLNSVKSAAAGDGFMSDLIGKVKGMVVNMIIPPVPIRVAGNEAMLEFAQAIVDGKASFTFPLAK